MSQYRQKLQALLRELFQFDSADLDFGIYAVMNHKRDQVERFIAARPARRHREGLQAAIRGATGPGARDGPGPPGAAGGIGAEAFDAQAT